ncbi:unnamed protein product, partial [Ceratitis capitata]
SNFSLGTPTHSSNNFVYWDVFFLYTLHLHTYTYIHTAAVSSTLSTCHQQPAKCVGTTALTQQLLQVRGVHYFRLHSVRLLRCFAHAYLYNPLKITS